MKSYSEVEMVSKKSMLLIALVLFVGFLSFDVGMAQTKRAKDNIFITGLVEEVLGDRWIIVMNDMKLFILPDTLIVDQEGNKLNLEHIKKKSDVAIDAVRQQNGYVIKKIVIIMNNGV